MNTLSRLLRALQLLIALYVGIAFVFTTNHLLAKPLHPILPLLLQPSESSFWTFSSSSRTSGSYEQISNHWNELLSTRKPSLYWNLSASVPHEPRPKLDDIFTMSEDLFLSKAFSNSLRPSKIVPFFYRATGCFDRSDITITTLITSNRFSVFAGLVARYQGV